MQGAPLVAHQEHLLARDFSLTAVVASEIEFSLSNSYDNPSLPLWRESVEQRSKAASIPLYAIEKERGRNQHEISLLPVADAFKCAQHTVTLREIIASEGETHGLRADFSAKPSADEPGNGLHIHVHLTDMEGRNIFTKKDADMSDALRFCIGGLLTWMVDCLPVFAPHAQSYARFAPGNQAPSTVSWGANNRTVALRLPDKAFGGKHIEHRVCGADADPHRAIAVILAAMHDGLTRRLEPITPQIYGDAAQAQYNLPRFPTSLTEALARMNASENVARYFSAEDLWPVSG